MKKSSKFLQKIHAILEKLDLERNVSFDLTVVA